MRFNKNQRVSVFKNWDTLASTRPHAVHHQFRCGDYEWMNPESPCWKANHIAATLAAHHTALMEVSFYAFENKPVEFAHHYAEAVRSLVDAQALLAEFMAQALQRIE